MTDIATCITCGREMKIRRRGQCARCSDMHLPYEQTALVGGTWVPDGRGIMRWVPDAKPVVVGGRVVGAEKPRPAVLDKITCPSCHAKGAEWCRTGDGKQRHDHASRLIPRLCQCGEERISGSPYCESCRIEARRETWRRYSRRSRAAQEAAA